MNKKIATQGLMIALIIFISVTFYLKYFKQNSKNLEKNKITTTLPANENTSSNYIDNINYTSLDSKGNKYQISAKQAEIDIDNENVMFLKDITAYIFIKDADIIKITSDFGKYNSKNYDTIFSKNVLIMYPNHKITGEYLDFSFLNNLGTISTDVIYFGNKTRLLADRVEINITTKDTKIFMDDNNKKVLIEG
ncbi:LPS export ABC transporter periplasmic protein LptC, partial [Candidatus Pelagibacter sp.]|nr:LPS export ABC transporter periplasmic protein LptC [Candidatus Pelagibacter sp.]